MKRLALSLAVLALCSWLAASALRAVEARSVRLEERAKLARLRDLYEVRAVELGWPDDSPEPRRGELTASEALLFFRTNGTIYRYDPLSYSVPKPLDEPPFYEFEEHPEGGFHITTNALGLREDEEVEPVKRDLRVIVAGDSHTYGLCGNSESFANRLEPLLTSRLGGRHVDVVNAGVGATCFQNYAGTFERLAHLDPDVLVLVAYGGNDFSATMALDRYVRGRPAPRHRPFRSHASRLPWGTPQQVTTQITYFRNNPGDVALAPATAAGLTLEARRVADELGAELLVVYLPDPFSAQPELHAELVGRATKVLGLDQRALDLADRLADAWLERLDAAGLRSIDLRPAFALAEERLYWQQDLHLNVAGHELVAEVLAPALAERLEAGATSADRLADR